MSDDKTSTTELTSQYIAQVTNDLERNTKEQERIAADITALQEQLSALQHDHTVLVTMQQALGGTRPATAAAATVAPVPSQASAPRKQTRAPKQTKQVQQAGAAQETRAKKAAPAATAKKTVAKGAEAKKTDVKKVEAKKADVKKTAVKKPAAGKPAAAAAGTSDRPSLVDLIRTHLEEQKEPRSAAEIATALTAAHPDRTIKTTVVRTTLENLVARSSAHRNKQGTSVFYTAVTEPAEATGTKAAESGTAAATA